ncbi:MAG: alpha/beta fold hydrolase [Rhodoferax sp.]|nr:alpha/beta fold hydrolase [Rhodoferax sp.]
MTPTTAQVDIAWDGQRSALECLHLRDGGGDASAPLLVFLHEGLGSVAMWKDFPQQVCEALQCQGLVISRPGYGQSTPLPEGTRWAPDFLERQALEVLPAALAALGINPQSQPLWLLGHSDGASIALMYAAAFPTHVAALVALAPHCFVEDQTVASIAALQPPEVQNPLLARLARYHRAPKQAFDAWSGIWLDSTFRSWSITDRMRRIGCRVLAVQGLDDEYGSLEQIRSIARALPGTRLLELEACGHSPHRDRPDALVAAICDFLNHNEGDIP